MAKKIRDILEIDEERCTGCGQCVSSCAEGAIALINGKAKVIADIYCDGLGACLEACPAGALHITRREADDFNGGAVREQPDAQAGCGCQDAHHRWPLKIRLVHEQASFLRGAPLLVAADCAAFAAPDFHQRLADGKVMLIGCPKFEGAEDLTRKLAAIVRTSKPESLLVARMEVPCCKALTKACLDALCAAEESIPQREAVISRAGEVTGS